MVTPPVQEDRIALVLEGEDQRQDFAFAFCLGIKLDGSSPNIEIESFTGAPSLSEIPLSNPNNSPGEIHSEIIQHRRDMIDKNKGTYIKQTEDQLLPIFDELLDDLSQLIRNQKQSTVTNYLEDKLATKGKFSSKFELDTYFLRFTALEHGQTKQEDESSKSSDEGNTSKKQFLKISPIISATHGQAVETIDTGTELMVNLSNQATQFLGIETTEDEEVPAVPAEFIQYEKTGADSDGTLEVKLKPDIHGISEIPPGTKIKLASQMREASGESAKSGSQFRSTIGITFFVIIVGIILALFLL